VHPVCWRPRTPRSCRSSFPDRHPRGSCGAAAGAQIDYGAARIKRLVCGLKHERGDVSHRGALLAFFIAMHSGTVESIIRPRGRGVPASDDFQRELAPPALRMWDGVALVSSVAGGAIAYRHLIAAT